MLAVLAAAPAADAQVPAVARAHARVDGRTVAGGTVFFLDAAVEGGIVAVGAAHSFDADQLRRAREVEFRLGKSERRVGVSTRLLAPPGVPFSAPGGTLRGDFLVFALDVTPANVRVLEADARPLPERGERVRILGVPAMIPRDEDDVFGTVRDASAARLEIDLDVTHDLRGWGGAPVIEQRGGRVLGLLEAAWPSGSTLRVAAAPIEAVRQALERPLDGGLGRPFSAFEATPGSPATAPAAAAKRPPARARPPRAPAPPREPILGRATREGTRPIWVELEHPTDGAVVSDPLGAFVAGRALAPRGDFRRIDVVVVIDTSGSTREPTGVDVNGNGVVGQPHFGALGGLFELGSTDPGDSILAAEVAAARHFMRSLDPRSTRVGLVTFAGEASNGGLFGRRKKPALTEVELTTDFTRVEQALDRVLQRGPSGSTHMAAGVDQATIELLGLRGAASQTDAESEKVVLFLTDGRPTLPYGPGFESDNVKAVLRAAERGKKAGVQVHTFGIGEEALAGPIALVELAGRTEGIFTPVRHPGDLVDVIEQVDFANVESVQIVNRTSGESANPLLKNPDGTFSGLVPLRAGRNRIEVVARANDGSEARTAVTLHFAPDGPEGVVPPPLVARRNRLLEQRLLELKRERIELERERAEDARKELLVEIERERMEARERAERQRKELELELEPEDGSDPGP